MLEEENTSPPTRSMAADGVGSSVSILTERVKQLTAHCNVMLVNDSLRDWDSSQADRELAATNINAVSELHVCSV